MRDVGFLDQRPGPRCDSAMHMAIFNADPGWCSLDTGYSFWVIQAGPTEDQAAAICRSSRCKSIVDVIRKYAPSECVMYDGFYAYQDILNPILAKCGSGPGPTLPPPTTPPPTTPPPPRPTAAPWTFTPGTYAPWTGSSIDTSPPSLRDSSTSTPSPGVNSASSSFPSSSDSGPPLGVIFGCVVGVILVVAFFLWIRQQRKRDPDVQRLQKLEYGEEGAFDTMVPMTTPTPSQHNAVYMAMEVASEMPSATVDFAPPKMKVLSASGSNDTLEKPTSNRSSLSSDVKVQFPLLLDGQITAARVPLEKIVIGERINSGGYGDVFKGTYKQDIVAIKKMLPQHRTDPRLINKFLEEIKLMTLLEHEHIVRFIGVAWETPTEICVLSEFMEGGDLRSMLKKLFTQKKPIGFDHAKLKIALHVAHALTYMHSFQPVVLHRDLKSSNILLSRELDAKITDFGVSRERIDATMTRGVGSALWMAPEIMMGGRYDDKADMFSFGVVLSELESNQLPYANQLNLNDAQTNCGDLMQSVAQGRLTVDFSYDSDPDMAALGRDCVAVDPATRPTAAEALHRVHQVLRNFEGYA